MIRCGIHTFQADTQNLLRRNPSPTEIAPLARLIFTGIFAHQCSEGSMSPGGCARESRYGTERAAQFPFEGERAVPVKIFTGSNSNNCSKCKFPGLGNFFWRLYNCFLKVNSCFWVPYTSFLPTGLGAPKMNEQLTGPKVRYWSRQRSSHGICYNGYLRLRSVTVGHFCYSYILLALERVINFP